MSGRIDFAAVAARLAERAEDVIAYLHGAQPKDRGGIYYCADAFGGAGTSTTFWLRAKRGEWYDHAAGEGGDLLKLWKIVRQHPDMLAAAREAMKWLGMELESPAEREKHLALVKERAAAREREEAEHNERLRRSALRHYLEGEPVRGTPVDEYLLGRGIDLELLGKQPGALRYREMKCPEQQKLRPCMIAAVTAPAGGFLTVHRHFLSCLQGGDFGLVVKASDPRAWRPMAEPKQCYGPKQGGIIPVWRGETGKPFGKLREPEVIICCEGVEDALSWAIVDPTYRVWAMIDLGNFGKCDFGGADFPGKPETIFWHRHRGDGPQALEHFENAKAAVEARGIEVRDLWAPDGAKDINEWLQKQPEYRGRTRFRGGSRE